MSDTPPETGNHPPILVDLIAGARPNFMKIAPLYHALRDANWCHVRLVHTGQHYDAAMSDTFFTDLGLPEPDINLSVGSGSHAEQTAKVMIAYEQLCMTEPPDWIVVVGDVNSTLACALVGAKLVIPVAHLEAGLRSGDRTMPEEINRIATDAISSLLWTPSPDADDNLRREGVPADRIARVGNIMIDAFEMLKARIVETREAEKLGLAGQPYGVVTLHRPSNVDHPATLRQIVAALIDVAALLPLVFPLHPRTRERLAAADLMGQIESCDDIVLAEPMSYIPFMSLVTGSRLVITDSGGIQEETSYLGIPCLTLRENTERPVTVTSGTNRLVTPDTLRQAVPDALDQPWSAYLADPAGQSGIAVPRDQPPQASYRPVIPLWDGRTAHRAAASLREAAARLRSTRTRAP
jgi:UDP-N-acetylglucosamine 2-epimerase (non-hydrolysing)